MTQQNSLLSPTQNEPLAKVTAGAVDKTPTDFCSRASCQYNVQV